MEASPLQEAWQTHLQGTSLALPPAVCIPSAGQSNSQGHRAVVALPLGSARCPGGTQSACEGSLPNLNLVLHFSALHFCISLLGLHFSQHFTSCTYFTFLHFTPCTYFSALHFTSCTHFSALPFLHLLSCITFLHFTSCTYWIYTPFFRDFPLEGGAFLEWGSARS